MIGFNFSGSIYQKYFDIHQFLSSRLFFNDHSDLCFLIADIYFFKYRDINLANKKVSISYNLAVVL